MTVLRVLGRYSTPLVVVLILSGLLIGREALALYVAAVVVAVYGLVDAVLDTRRRRQRRRPAPATGPGGYMVPSIYAHFGHASIDPERRERLRRLGDEWAARPWREKAASRIAGVYRELGWRVRTATRILLLGDDGRGE